MTIKIENETHWRTSDIKRVVLAALTAGGMEPGEDIEINVVWLKKGVPWADPILQAAQEPWCVTVRLPRCGPKDLHRNEMLAVALAAACDAPKDATILSPSYVFRVANSVAYHCANNRDVSKECFHQMWERFIHRDVPPPWAPIETFFVQKYADPLKDGTYVEFVNKKEKALKRAEQDMTRAEYEAEAANARLKKARARKKAAEKSLQAARARRTG